jgi:transcriptional regulator with XRE-family HTH domain
MKKYETPNAVVAFGEFLRQWRKSVGLTSRKVALEAGMQPSNYCRMENGTLNPPQDNGRIKAIFKALKLRDGSDEAVQFYDLAAKANKAVPLDIAEIISRDEAVPLMLRTIGNRRLSESEIQGIIELIRGSDETALSKKNKKRT